MRRPAWLGHSMAVVLAVTAVIGLSVALAWPWWDYVFLSDDSAVSWLSSALLVANAAVALAVRVGGGRRAGFGILALACLVMGLDEQLHLHERVQVRFGDEMAVAYGALLVVGGIAWIRRASPHVSPTVRRAFWLALAVGAISVGIDLAAEGTAWGWTEELWEVAAESVWLCGLLEQARVQVQSGSST